MVKTLIKSMGQKLPDVRNSTILSNGSIQKERELKGLDKGYDPLVILCLIRILWFRSLFADWFLHCHD